jgi:EAL domain-containing protein (putative c-di-GMP-specific phosphodiesterase class I)
MLTVRRLPEGSPAPASTHDPNNARSLSMTRVIDCLAADHDLRLVLMAAAVCAFGTVASMVVSSRALKDRWGRLWLLFLALCAGSTVWATHFLAMPLDDSDLPGERLELEVTESLLIDNREEVLRTLTALKRLGVRIAMDDFGTGYSSLSYLQCLPFDKIKIDRTFVSHLEAGSRNASIVRAVALMGRSLNMRVVAEGVETSDQARLLKDLDCDELQGYLIAKPMPAADVEKFLRTAGKKTAAPAQLAA